MYTDRDAILTILLDAECGPTETESGTIIAAGRKFTFTVDGELRAVIDYVENRRADHEGIRPYKKRAR